MTVILRKLTRKSTFDFGKRNGQKIGFYMDNKQSKNKSYLYWVYYNCSNLSYVDELLDELGILPEYRIEKPGKDPILFYLLQGLLFDRNIRDEFNSREKIHGIHKTHDGVAITRSKKGFQSWVNHGHNRNKLNTGPYKHF